MNAVIIIAYHKRDILISGDPFLPVHAGRALMTEDNPDREWLTENLIGDDTGENISAENRTYNELTALYWAWKNTESDAVGFMHYRRHFVFDKTVKKNYLSTARIKEGYVSEKLKFTDGVIDGLLRDKCFVCAAQERSETVREHYRAAHGLKGLEITERVIREKYPDYAEAAADYFDGKTEYFYNMFIMRRDIFERYADFLFGVLGEVAKELDGERLYPSERITGVFMTRLIHEGYTAVRLPVMFVRGRQTFRAAWAESKRNLKANKARKGGFKGRIYALKPILKKLIPDFIFARYYNRKRK